MIKFKQKKQYCKKLFFSHWNLLWSGQKILTIFLNLKNLRLRISTNKNNCLYHINKKETTPASHAFVFLGLISFFSQIERFFFRLRTSFIKFFVYKRKLTTYKIFIEVNAVKENKNWTKLNKRKQLLEDWI